MKELYIGMNPKGWFTENSGEKEYESQRDIAKVFSNLEELEFDDVYYNGVNLANLVIKIKDSKIIIINYNKIKNNPMFNDLNIKIKKGLLTHAIKIIPKKLKLDKKKVIAATIAITSIVTSYAAIKNSNTDTKVINTTMYEESVSSDEQNTQDIELKDKEVLNFPEIKDDENTKTQILDYFDQYSTIFSIDESIKINLLNQNIDFLMNSNNIESDVIDILYSYYESNMYLAVPVTYNNYTEDEQVKYILKYAEIKGVKNEDELLTLLAVHKLESGHGESENCRNYNNLGGIFGTNPNNNQWEIKKYPNMDVAAIDFVNVFERIKNNCVNLESYDPNQTLEYNMNPMYCTKKMNPDDPEWYMVVRDIKNRIKENNILNQNTQLR